LPIILRHQLGAAYVYFTDHHRGIRKVCGGKAKQKKQ
jgi:hypothetical protein